MKIKAAEKSDLPLIRTLLNAITDSTDDTLLLSVLDNDPFRYFVVSDSEPIGCVGIKIIPPDAEIVDISVHRNRRGEGYGRALLSHALDECRANKIERVSLEVRHRAEAAIGLYEVFGFERIHTREKYYKNGDDAYLMVLNLGGPT